MVLGLMIYHSTGWIVNNYHGSGEKQHKVLLRGSRQLHFRLEGRPMQLNQQVYYLSTTAK